MSTGAAIPKSLATEKTPAAPPVPATPVMSGLRETIYFGLRNRKLVFGLGVTLVMLLFAVFGPMLAQHPPLEFGGNLSHAPTMKDGYWFGTTLLGQDV